MTYVEPPFHEQRDRHSGSHQDHAPPHHGPSDALRELPSADVVYALRMQSERMTEAWVPSLREYATWYQINGRRLGPRQVLMHPGPVNRGVELSGEVVDSPQAVITAQVEAGVVVRMAVLYELLSGSPMRGAAPTHEPQLA